jgi:acyl-CoA synthetase (AMP-forming)/AMP-acid ligase II
VALLATNSPEFIIAYLAVLRAGHIVMPIDPVFKKLEIDAILDRLQPAMLVAQERYQDQVGEHRMPTHFLQKLLEQPASEPNHEPLRLTADKQVASLTFTSGTSGMPKAVPNTHANHIWNIQACSAVWDWTADDSLLITLPLSHMHGLVIGLSGIIYHGNTLYLHQQSFDAKAVLRELASGKISIFTHARAGRRLRLIESQADDIRQRAFSAPTMARL